MGRSVTRAWSLAAVAAAAVLLAWTLAQDDRFSFLPRGGQQLLEHVLGACDACEGLAAWSTAARTRDEWTSLLEERGALADLSDAEAETLARYLSIALPLDEAATAVADLPLDGRTLVIFQCQTCHAITIAVTQDREVPYWLQHRTQPPHDALDLSEAEWRHVANYLALQTPIPEDAVPAELRQGAGGY